MAADFEPNSEKMSHQKRTALRLLAERGVKYYSDKGKKGAEKLKEKGVDYAALGQKGGRAFIERHGVEAIRELGQSGGQATARIPGHLPRIAERGGEVTSQKGPLFYADIARKKFKPNL